MRAAFALVFAVALPAVLPAQETGTFLPHRPATATGSGMSALRDTVRQFGQCALSKSPGFVAKALDAPVGSADYDRWIRRVADGDCLGSGTLKLNVTTMRGALFEASYLHAFGHGGPTDFAAVAPIDYAARYGQKGNGAAEAAVRMAEFGDCVVRADGQDAKALIVALPGSSDETAAIAGLRPRLTGCVEKNVAINFDRTAFRSAIAEGLYRLSAIGAPAERRE